jgi:hypothetical protein
MELYLYRFMRLQKVVLSEREILRLLEFKKLANEYHEAYITSAL